MGARVYEGYGEGISSLGLKENLATVWRLLRKGIDFPPTFERSKESELRELIAPHFPVLMHKRERFQSMQDSDIEHWGRELHTFVDRMVAPLLGLGDHMTGNERNRLVRMIDTFVSDEVARLKNQSSPLPVTSRFDSSWAT